MASEARLLFPPICPSCSSNLDSAASIVLTSPSAFVSLSSILCTSHSTSDQRGGATIQLIFTPPERRSSLLHPAPDVHEKLPETKEIPDLLAEEEEAIHRGTPSCKSHGERSSNSTKYTAFDGFGARASPLGRWRNMFRQKQPCGDSSLGGTML
jgi:hypothetical protein